MVDSLQLGEQRLEVLPVAQGVEVFVTFTWSTSLNPAATACFSHAIAWSACSLAFASPAGVLSVSSITAAHTARKQADWYRLSASVRFKASQCRRFPGSRQRPSSSGSAAGEGPSRRDQARIDDLARGQPDALVDDRHGLGAAIQLDETLRHAAHALSVSGWSGPSLAFRSASVSSLSLRASACRPRAA